MPDRKPDFPTKPSGTRRLVAPEFLPALDLIPDISMSADLLPHARAAVAALGEMPLPEALQGVRVEELRIPSLDAGRDMRVVLYRPAGELKTPGPAVLHIHGGGFVVGTPEMEQRLARTLAVDGNCLVVSVDYRLAPETPYPGAVEDCYAALQWIHQDAEALGVDPQRVAIAGNSAGGGHAATLAIYARGKGGPSICMQILDQPMLDDRTGSTADPQPFCGEFGHTPESNRFGWQALLGMEPGGPGVPAQAVPSRVADLSNLPPTFMSVGSLDLFLEETLEYARRLWRAGVPTELHVFSGGFHGWEMASEASQTKSSADTRRDALRRGLTRN